MEDRYSIENLIKTFQRHSDLSKKRHLERSLEQREEMERNMKKNDPDDWDFDITLALRSMCGEILDMNDRINEIVDHLNGDRG